MNELNYIDRAIEAYTIDYKYCMGECDKDTEKAKYYFGRATSTRGFLADLQQLKSLHVNGRYLSDKEMNTLANSLAGV